MAVTAAAYILPKNPVPVGKGVSQVLSHWSGHVNVPWPIPVIGQSYFPFPSPNAKPNQIRSLPEIFCVISQCPGIKNSPSCDLQSPPWSSSQLPLSSLLSTHSSPHFWALSLWLSSAFGIQCLTTASRVFTYSSSTGSPAPPPTLLIPTHSSGVSWNVFTRGLYAINSFFLIGG